MRKRHSDDAVINITGRDVIEAQYAFTVTDGIWELAGTTLAAAASEAETRRERSQLGDRALEVLAFINSRNETRAADLTALSISKEQARVYLHRLADSGRIAKAGRGLFKPNSIAVADSVIYVSSVTSKAEDITEITNITPISSDVTPLVAGPGRCTECGLHVATQGHRDDCRKPVGRE